MDHELGRQLDKVVASYNGSLNGAARSRKMS
jgi:hypothetical protein